MKFRCLIYSGVLLFLMLQGSFISPDEVPPVHNAVLPDENYVVVDKDGHLSLKGNRIRFWGTIGAYARSWHGPDTTISSELQYEEIRKRYRDLEVTVERIEKMGFNMHRLWPAPDPATFKKGDGSYNDMLAFFLKELGYRNIYVWNAAINRGSFCPADVNIIDDPETSRAWETAVNEWINIRNDNQAEPGRARFRGCLAKVWDPRIEALCIHSREKYCNWKNL